MIDIKKIPKIAFVILKAKAGIKTPLKVTQYLTYKCNLNCSFCGRRGSSKELTLEEIKKMMDEFKKMGTMFWGFNGGEPLLRNDVDKIIKYAKSLGFKCTMSTNGILVPKHINFLKKLDAVLVSIDGDEKIHDEIRGKGNYKKAVQGIKTLRKNGIKTIIWTVINKTNYKHLDEIMKLAETYGCEWEVQPVCRHKEDKEGRADDFLLSPEELSDSARWLIEQKKRGKPISNSDAFLELMHENKKQPDCFASVLFCAISPDGYIVPCADFLYKSENFRNCSNGVKKVFKSLPNMSKCHNCSFGCYMEYNLLLNSLTKSAIRALGNIIRGQVFWK